MSDKVTIIDYGCGNLLSVARAIERCGGRPLIAQNSDEIEKADRLILPGVGAFGDGMRNLRERELLEPIMKSVALGRPMLGICLGMQILATYGDEFGRNSGMDLIPGGVVRIPSFDIGGATHKLPHIGWSEIVPASQDGWQHTILKNVRPGASVYLVHSYYFKPSRDEFRIANCFYGGHKIAAAIQSGSVIGCQFHPEKSGEVGLAILDGFLRL